MSTDFKPRQPKGIPVGGHSAVAHNEPGFARKEERFRNSFRQSMVERRELLRSAGFIPGTVLPALTTPAMTEHREAVATPRSARVTKLTRRHCTPGTRQR